MRNCYLYPALLGLVLLAGSLTAGPSSIFWTNCTTAIYPAGLIHLDGDTYFNVVPRKHDPSVPSDTGLEAGLLNWHGVQAEAGFDYAGGVDYPLALNAGAAIPEGWLFPTAPSLKVGLFGFGLHTSSDKRNNQNIVDVIVGFSLPEVIGGRVFFGGFSGGSAMGKNRQGLMASYQKFFCPATGCDGVEYHRWMVCCDWASGKNTIGGGGVALGYYPHPDVSILTGPIWFNSAAINGRWKWSLQLGINFSFFDGCRIGK
ncbi:hypothetical protein [Estrella lausannensis]|uniref:Putative membrane protein n=1 Tax=Estrella lausannensis TaxID=483423 RepID=A0A0H5DQL4_9BACT|nr:hypothetical protein [Estrella lausannensis]CRX38832.1 putative membrane protein [Estrella lausannensis]